jgi:hypothetical protein
MSFIVFEQTDHSFHGAMIYDATGEWEIDFATGDLFEGRCRSEEGEGSWLIVDHENNHWGTVLRRDDSPYNDCLPPSESLLSEAFREENDLESRVKYMASAAESGFYNPFNALVGSVGDSRTILLQQSFQTKTRVLDPGSHQLCDHGSLDEPDDSIPNPSDGIPDTDALKPLYENRRSPDGLREPRAVLHLEYDGNQWQGDGFVDHPPLTHWDGLKSKAL